ncbi:MAG: hypothetical protein ACO3EE_09045 [Flavobacteriales bacterium]
MTSKRILQFALLGAVVLSSCKKKTTTEEENNNNNNTVVTDPCTMEITKTNGPMAGVKYVLGTDTNFAGDTNNYAKLGTSATWLFGTAQSDEEDDFDFANPTGENLTNYFPTASYIIKAKDAEIAGVSSDSGVVFTGAKLPPFIAGINIYPKFINPATFIPYTLSMNMSKTDTYKAVAKVAYDTTLTIGMLGTFHFDSMEVTLSGKNSLTANGCGKITTPTGTYDCIKYVLNPGAVNDVYKAHLVGTGWGDYTWAKALIGFKTPKIPYINAKTYFWVSKEKGFPVCMVSYDDKGKATVQYLK